MFLGESPETAQDACVFPLVFPYNLKCGQPKKCMTPNYFFTNMSSLNALIMYANFADRLDIWSKDS